MVILPRKKGGDKKKKKQSTALSPFPRFFSFFFFKFLFSRDRAHSSRSRVFDPSIHPSASVHRSRHASFRGRRSLSEKEKKKKKKKRKRKQIASSHTLSTLRLLLFLFPFLPIARQHARVSCTGCPKMSRTFTVPPSGHHCVIHTYSLACVSRKFHLYR